MIKKIIGSALASLILLAMPAISIGGLGNLILDSQKASKAKVSGIGAVVFTHGKHAKRVKCAICHPKIFKKKKGASGINMKGNMEGKFCGSMNCHNSQKAFPLYECNKCHRKK